MNEQEKQPQPPETKIPHTTANDNVGEDITGVTPTPEAPETAAVEAAETTDAQQKPKKGFLKKAFNFVVKAGIGAAVSAVLKTGAVVGAGVAGAPAWATFLIAGVSVGAGSTLAHDYFVRRDLKKQGATLAPYFSKAHAKQLVSKDNLKVFGISTIAAFVGSALYLGFHDGIIQNGWNSLTGHTPAVPLAHPTSIPAMHHAPSAPSAHHAPVVMHEAHHAPMAPSAHHAPVVMYEAHHAPVAPSAHHTPVVMHEAHHAPVAPSAHHAPVVMHEAHHTPVAPSAHHHVAAAVVAPVHCLTPIQQFTNLIKGHHVSSAVHGAIHRAASTNAHVHAQGVKDLGYYAQNGFGGVPKNTNVALQLFKQAAKEGNKQAMRGMLYLQHYGLDGITANKTASLAAMKTITHDSLATKFVHAWSGAGKAVPAAKFNADAIVKGVKFACPT